MFFLALVPVLGGILILVAWIWFREPDVRWPAFHFGRWPFPWGAKDHLKATGLAFYWTGYVVAAVGIVLNLLVLMGGA